MPHLNGSYIRFMRAIVICPNENLKKEFEQAIAPHWMLNVSRTLDAYPSADDLRRVVRAWAPEIVFLDIESSAMAEIISRRSRPSSRRSSAWRSIRRRMFRCCGRFCTCI